MKFYPNRKSPIFFCLFLILSFFVSQYFVISSFNLIILILSILFFGMFIFFLLPIIKNQIVEVKDNHIILFNFGKCIELWPKNLYEIVDRKNGLISYRFIKGSSRYQISPCGYYDSKLLQSHFKKLFW